jgi:hypothetical protein
MQHIIRALNPIMCNALWPKRRAIKVICRTNMARPCSTEPRLRDAFRTACWWQHCGVTSTHLSHHQCSTCVPMQHTVSRSPRCNCDDYECPWSVLQIGATCGSAYIECATIGLLVAIATPSPIFVAAAAAVSHTMLRKRRNARVPPAVSIPGCVVPASTSACTTGCSSSTRSMGVCA